MYTQTQEDTLKDSAHNACTTMDTCVLCAHVRIVCQVCEYENAGCPCDCKEHMVCVCVCVFPVVDWWFV